MKERSEIMAQTNLSIRMDEALKREFDLLCENIGMSMTTAICIFAKKAVSEQKIPFEVTANDKFYAESNIRYLNKIIDGIEDGTRPLAEHDLIEVDEEE